MAVARAGDRTLIGSDSVEGTNVFDGNGNHIGHIKRLMIDRLDGRVSYAVVGFGGLLGAVGDAHPLPWSALTYDPGLDGYRVEATEDEILEAPKFPIGIEWDWTAILVLVDEYWSRDD